MPLVSVIIPAYNSQKTIKQTIQSVLDQTFCDFELIVVNASSTDLTLDILSQIKDTRLKIITYPQANVAVNRNRGFAHASGEFITFLDADDLWTPDKLELQYKALQENPEAGVVYSWTDCIDETGKTLRGCSYVKWTGDVYSNFLLDDFIGSGSNVMIRQSAFTAIGGFDELLTNAQDTDMWLRLAAHYHFVVVPKAQILYRISANSMSSNISGLEKSNLQVIERAYMSEKAASLQHLKQYSIANLYKYLSYKALSTHPGEHNGTVAARFLWQAVKTDWSMLLTPVIYKALLKLVVMTLFSPVVAQTLLNKFARLSNTSTFLGYEKVDLI